MESYLEEKWSEEMEELNSRTNPKQIISVPEKAPKIFQSQEVRQSKQEQQYIVGANNLSRSRSANSKKKKISNQKSEMVGNQESMTFKQKNMARSANQPDEATNYASFKQPSETDLTASYSLTPSESEIKEVKSIVQPVLMNTLEEIKMFERLNEEQEREAEKDMLSLLRKKSGSLINDFTQIRDPFRGTNLLQRTLKDDEDEDEIHAQSVKQVVKSQVFPAQSFKKITTIQADDMMEFQDMQIANVVMTEQELIQLENKSCYSRTRSKSINRQKSKSKSKSIVKSKSDYKSRSKSKSGFRSKSKPRGLETKETPKKRDPDSEPQLQSTNEKSGSKFAPYLKLLGLKKNKKVPRKKGNNTPKKMATSQERIIEKDTNPVHVRKRPKPKHTNSVNIVHSQNLFKSQISLNENNNQQERNKRVCSLSEFTPNAEDSQANGVSERNEELRESNRGRHLEWEAKPMFNKTYHLSKIQETPHKDTNRLITKKKNHIKKNKKNIGKTKSKLEHKSYLSSNMEKKFSKMDNKIESPDQDSFFQIRENRWKNKRNERKIERIDSSKKFFKDMVGSIEKMSSKISCSVERLSIDSRKAAERFKFSLVNGNSSSQNKFQSGLLLETDKHQQDKMNTSNLINRMGLDVDSPKKKESVSKSFYQKSDHYMRDFSGGYNTGKMSLGTGKLSNFLSNFKLLESRDDRFAETPNQSKFGNYVNKKETVERNKALHGYRPSLNNKELAYLTSNSINGKARSSVPDNKSTEKNKFMNKTDWLGNLIKQENYQNFIDNEWKRNKFLQSDLPLNVSQQYRNSPKNIRGKNTRYRKDENRMSANNPFNNNEMENLKRNFDSYEGRLNTQNKTDSWDPAIEGNMNSRQDPIKANYRSLVQEIDGLKYMKDKLVKRLSDDIDKSLLSQVLGEVFAKFKKDKQLSPQDIDKLNLKFFKHFSKSQKQLMPSIYKLINVEIAIQSKSLSCGSF